ncbi:MAG: hypothetical protein U5J96_08955 [Ignavibacteriaceae bacterium]|nr:hypothetical protein [Ignavibacteriaceae bacterium]
MKYFLAAVFSNLLFTTSFIFGDVTLLGSLNPYPNSAYTDIWGYEANGDMLYGSYANNNYLQSSNPEEVVFITGPFAPPYEWRD